MELLATFELGTIIPVLFVLACPLMMIAMMRGMHGGHGHSVGRGYHGHEDRSEKSLDELKRERDELNEEIGSRAERTATR